MVVRHGCEVVESDHVVRPQPDALLVAEPGQLLPLLVPQEVAVVVPHLGVVGGAGQAGPEQRRPGGPDGVPVEEPGAAHQEEGEEGDGDSDPGPGQEQESLRPPGHQDTPAQAGGVESSLSCHESHSVEYIAGGQERQ